MTTSAPVEETASARLYATAVLAAVAGVVLGVCARLGAAPLLVAVAVLQALLVLALAYGVRVPGRQGVLVIGSFAAVASDVAVSVWPDSRLGPLLAVLGLAVPAMFVHQLMRGAARVRVEASLGGAAVLVASVVAAAALVQVRHTLGADAAFAVVVVVAVAIVVGCLVDLVVAVPRFDADVPRGLVAVLVSAAVGAAVGELALRDVRDYDGGRALFVGAAVGLVAALLAVGASFADQSVPAPRTAVAARLRAVLTVLVPFALVVPVGLVLGLAIRH